MPDLQSIGLHRFVAEQQAHGILVGNAQNTVDPREISTATARTREPFTGYSGNSNDGYRPGSTNRSNLRTGEFDEAEFPRLMQGNASVHGFAALLIPQLPYAPTDHASCFR